MTVGWTSRAKTNENVTLRSIVAMYDPMTTGLSSMPPAGTPTRKPMNRDAAIPWGAVKHRLHRQFAKRIPPRGIAGRLRSCSTMRKAK